MPEIIPVNASVHFKCAFDVSSDSVTKLMTHLRQKFRSWCIRRVGGNDPTLHRSWFYIGNHKSEPHYIINGFQVRTVMAPSEDPEEPNCWALEMIHSDDDERARRWSVEITLRRSEDGAVRFTTINKHWMLPYFIGEYPESPSASVPRYVSGLLADNVLVCKRGDAVVSSNWHTVSNQNARDAFESLISPDRLAPSVFMAADTDTGRALIDPAVVMKTVHGNANVYFLPSASVIAEMNYYLGDDLRCDPGVIRVFVPGLQCNDPHNAKLHRYLSRNVITELGETRILQYLTNGLARNGMTFRLSDLTSFQHIFTERRKHAIRSLASEKESATEERKMVWEDNELLVTQAAELESQVGQLEAENRELKQNIGNLRYRAQEGDKIKVELLDLKSQVSGINGLAELPVSLKSVLLTIERLFSTHVEVSEQACAAAEDYADEHGGHWGKKEHVATAWSMVFDVATKLYRLVFTDEVAKFAEQFNAQSKFELAMTEGKQTKKDGRLMGLRKIVHDGKEYDITPHVKYGNRAPKLLRLHFAIDSDKKKFVIGHFGGHLENYSSRKH